MSTSRGVLPRRRMLVTLHLGEPTIAMVNGSSIGEERTRQGKNSDCDCSICPDCRIRKAFESLAKHYNRLRQRDLDLAQEQI